MMLACKIYIRIWRDRGGDSINGLPMDGWTP
jgi:hypothetical protein